MSINQHKTGLVVTIIALMVASTHSHNTAAWKQRTIYQVLTDRFSTPTNSTTPCKDLSNYCGGTWAGLRQNLDYIQTLGFDAIWISPVFKNIPKGYHGYWKQDLYSLNPHFGQKDDFEALLSDLHRRGMWIMVGVVPNYMGYVPNGDDFSGMVPFNRSEFYHPYCDIRAWDFSFDQYRMENCWLAGLPDLNQTVPFVKKTLIDWIRNFTKNFKIDGLRIDTAFMMPKWFLEEFNQAGGLYTMGEAFDSRYNYVAGYQGPLDGMMNYPLFYAIVDVFAYGRPMGELSEAISAIKRAFSDPGALTIFVDNHDNSRFLFKNPSKNILKSSLCFVLFAEGIPIVYYGTEQGFNGGRDPKNREPLWTSKMDRETDLYRFLATGVKYRKKMRVWESQFVERLARDSLYVFSRGDVLVAVANKDLGRKLAYRVKSHPYEEGDLVCDIFGSVEDCIEVKRGALRVVIENERGRVFVRKGLLEAV